MTVLCQSQSCYVMAGPVLGPYYDGKMPSAITIRKLRKKKKKDLLLTGLGKHTAHLGPHSKFTSKERERMCLGFCFYWGQG